MKSAVTFHGYRWYTAHNNSADQNRALVKYLSDIVSYVGWKLRGVEAMLFAAFTSTGVPGAIAMSKT